MLYISRCAGINAWYVMDTDDGTEELATHSKLKQAIKSGMTIAGVTPEIVNRNGHKSLGVGRVEVYTGVESCVKVCAKPLVMQGVDIRVRDGEILTVSSIPGDTVDNARVRLSDYGNRCSNYILTHTQWTKNRVIIVLDDRIKITAKTFGHFFGIFSNHIAIDITAVRNNRTVESVYRNCISSERGTIRKVEQYIIDIPERMKLWKAISSLSTGELLDRDITPEINEAVIKYVIKDFRDLPKIQLKYVESREDSTKSRVHAYIGYVSKDSAFWRSKCQDYEKVRAADDRFQFDMLSHLYLLFPVNFYKMLRLKRFLDFFEPNDEIKKLYVDACNRVNNYVLDELSPGSVMYDCYT